MVVEEIDKRQTVLITGCSIGGIGHALALNFNSRGFRVFATARDPDSISSLAALGITTLALEVHKVESVKALRDQVSNLTRGRLDYLVNNAGSNYTVPALDIDDAEVHNLFEANVFGVMRMCQTFIPLLIEAKGTIVQIGSLTGHMPYIFSSGYNASKAALHAYTNTLRNEISPFDVNVVLVVPGGVKSNLSRVHRQLPSSSLYQPVQAEYEKRLMYSQVNSVPTEEFARRVVPQILQKKREIWEGKMSWIVYYVMNYVPFGMRLLDLFFYRSFGLWKLVSKSKST